MEKIEQPLREIGNPIEYLSAFERGLPKLLDSSITLPMHEEIPAIVMEIEWYLFLLLCRHRKGTISEEQLKNAALLQKNLIPMYALLVSEEMEEVAFARGVGALQADDAKDQLKQYEDAQRRLIALKKMIDLHFLKR